MADKKFIVNTTIQTRDKAGKKVVIARSAEPQEVPAGLVKELLAKGVITLPSGADAEADGDGNGAGGET